MTECQRYPVKIKTWHNTQLTWWLIFLILSDGRMRVFIKSRKADFIAYSCHLRDLSMAWWVFLYDQTKSYIYRKWAPCRTRYIPHLTSPHESPVYSWSSWDWLDPSDHYPSSSYNRRAAAACTDQMRRRDRHVLASEPNVLEQMSDHFPDMSINGLDKLSTGLEESE